MEVFRVVPASVVILAVMLAGCASGLSKDECRVADWYAIGYEDGVRGHGEQRIAEHRKACARHEVSMDLERYRRGRDEGLTEYCTASSGYQQGRRGRTYNGVCPQRTEADFLAAYREGRRVYDAERELERLDRRLSGRYSRLDEIETTMRDHGIEIAAPDTATQRRIVLVDELRKLGEERETVRDEIERLEPEIERQQREVDGLRARQRY